MKHACHVPDCETPCSPRMLMCRAHWTLVPANLQREVWRTVGKRSRSSVNETWAPWWRAQAKAIHAVMVTEHRDEQAEPLLEKALRFADGLEARGRLMDTYAEYTANADARRPKL